jgi:tetratricopeptide (TPR) repeat protein
VSAGRVLGAALIALVLPATAGAAVEVGGVVLPDTGLFAPVAGQYRARLARLEALERGPVVPERLEALLGTGRAEEALRLLGRLAGDPRASDLETARALLARQAFEPLGPVMERLAADPDPDEATRATVLAWLRALDDAARIDGLTRGALATPGDRVRVADLVGAGRLAYDRLEDAHADSCFRRALEVLDSRPAGGAAARRSAALTGLGQVLHRRREFDASLERLRDAVAAEADGDALEALAQTLVRLGRTDEAIGACEWAVALDPLHAAAHYLLGNGYTRRNYTQLEAARPEAFADRPGREALSAADRALARGDRAGARAAYARVEREHPGWVDARVRLASLDFEDGRFEAARDRCVEALRICPDYGRAHAVLAKALESRRFAVDVHRAGYEARFAARGVPEIPGIERFVTNWRSLSPRHQKRVALSVAPWKAFLPVLIEGGATFYIKPLYMRLSECPDLETLEDQRIDYDSRLWDDVRGCGGYHTVTGIEDVERTIFDRYDTVLHELTHQVHGVLPADDARAIEEHYRAAKARDEATRNGFLSRYAGGSVWEYFAEGANALHSPKRDAYDPREVVRERLDAMDPALRGLVERFMARADVSGSYPVAYVNAGDDRVSKGRVDEALPFYRRALERAPREETALRALTSALVLEGDGPGALAAAERARAAHPASGAIQVAAADALWHAGRGLAAARASLEQARPGVRTEDLLDLDLARARLAWVAGDADASLAAADSALARQADHPGALRARAAALALAGRFDEAFPVYEQAVRLRTGIVELRVDVARDLLRAGRPEAAEAHLDEARLLDATDPDAEALRGSLALARGQADSAAAHGRRALAWGEWCDLARLVLGAAEQRLGHEAAAREAWAPLDARVATEAPPRWVYRASVSQWRQVGVMPAVERALRRDLAGRGGRVSG